MEMNTRLQVEHPVTEMITGLDLVEWQLRVAAGEPLPLRQDQLAIDGHAIEARIYAEDPDKGFLPSTGKLLHLSPPAESEHVRVDTGVEQGDAITPHYDPMIAKLIVWDSDRPKALARMRQALAQYRVVGVANNVEFLSRLVSVPSFANADLDTALIEREQANLFPAKAAVPDEVWLLAALAELQREAAAARHAADRESPWRMLDGWRLNGQATRSDHAAPRRVGAGGVGAGRGRRPPARPGRPRGLSCAARPAPTASCMRSWASAASMPRWWSAPSAGMCSSRAARGRCRCSTRCNTGGAGEDVEGGLKAPMPGKVIALIAAGRRAASTRARRCWCSRR